MATSSIRSTSSTTTKTTQAKKPAVKKSGASPSKIIVATASKKTAAVPAKKVAETIRKETTTSALKANAPKVEKLAPAGETTPNKSVKKTTVIPEERYNMIAVAAYCRAEQRGFACTCQMHDWLSAEAEIDAMLKS